MKRDYTKILNDLPKDWSELNYATYKKISINKYIESAEDDVEAIFVGQENTLRMLSVITGIPVEEFRSENYNNIIPLAQRISFINELPEYDKKHETKWRKIDKISYDNYVSFLTYSKDPNAHMGDVVREFSVKEISDEEIDQLSMLEVYSAFFTLNRSARKFIRISTNRLHWKLVKQLIREHLIQPFRQKFSNKRNRSEKHTDGIS